MNREIISLCPNYYNIVNAKINEKDVFTEKIIKTYERFVFRINVKIESEVKKLKRIDKIMSQYLEDSKLRNEIINGFKNLKVSKAITDIVDFIVCKIISIYDNYLENCTRKIYIPRWI